MGDRLDPAQVLPRHVRQISWLYGLHIITSAQTSQQISHSSLPLPGQEAAVGEVEDHNLCLSWPERGAKCCPHSFHKSPWWCGGVGAFKINDSPHPGSQGWYLIQHMCRPGSLARAGPAVFISQITGQVTAKFDVFSLLV